MDCCLLCLQTNKSIKSRINIFEKEAAELNIEEIIKTHFWIEPDINKHKFMCKRCWEALKCFHEFYMRIKEAHQLLKDIGQEQIVKRRRGRPPKKSTPNASEETEKNTEFNSEDVNCDDWQEKETVLLAEVKLEDHLEEHKETEFMNLFYNMMDEPNTSTISNEQPLQEMSIKEEKPSENMTVDDPIDEFSPSVEDKQESEKEPQKQRVAKTNNESKNTDDFIAQNFILSCPLCSENMETFAALKQHFRQKHNTRGYAFCCGKKLLKRCVLLDHIQFHLNPKYFKCTRCDKVLCDRRSLEKHEENHDDKKERVFVCPTCSKSFFRRCVYQRHILLHVPAEQKTVPCPKCEKTFANKYTMNQHLKLVHLNLYAKVCDVCGKMIRGLAAMQRHKEEHEGIEQSSIQCEQCGITLTNKYGLARHIRVQHTAENLQPQVCPICSKVSPNLSAHQRHVQYMHHMQRKHACPMCNKAFRRATELKEHMTTHTGEVLYTCPHCPKTFNSNANMYAHRKKAHLKEWEESRQSRFHVGKSLKSEKSVLAKALETTVTSVASMPSARLETAQN